jgi:hypothetical protein
VDQLVVGASLKSHPHDLCLSTLTKNRCKRAWSVSAPKNRHFRFPVQKWKIHFIFYHFRPREQLGIGIFSSWGVFLACYGSFGDF